MSFCLLAALSLSSCDTEDGYLPDPTNIGGYSYLSQRTISPFDTNTDLNIKIFTDDGVTAESIDVLEDGQVIGTAQVSGETATFNTSNLDSVATGKESWSVRLRTTLSNGNVAEDPFTISVSDAVSVSGDNASEAILNSLDTTSVTYETFTRSATIDGVDLMLKKNSDGTYMDSGADVSADGGTVVLGDTNYDQLNLQVHDTLYYKFVATSGDLSAEAESYIEIIPNAFSNENTVVLHDDTTMNQLNFATGKITADGDTTGEVAFMSPTGFEAVNSSDIQFVEVTTDGFFDTADLDKAKEAFDAGSPVTSVSNLESGDVYVYKVTRDVTDEDGNTETMTYYGVMKIGDVTVVNGTAVSFEIHYFEGTL